MNEYVESKVRQTSIFTLFYYGFFICIITINSVQTLYAQPESVFNAYVQALLAGLYNYYTDTLVAKYILSFSPSNEYWNLEERIMRFRLEKSVLNQKISDFQLRLVEP